LSSADTTGQRDRSRVREAISWFFSDPETGRVVIAQWPNLPLWAFLAATAVRLIASPSGTAGTVVTAVGSISLAVWAVLEVARGDSPFRRVLGGVVLVAIVIGTVLR
jgi:hypothetical protein